jgi:glycosyltransferase involved in cell wall biosynthesis
MRNAASAWADARDPDLSGRADAGKAMDVAVVIPALNEAATIRDVASRALRQVARVIVVDDGSRDGTASTLHGLPVQIFRNPHTLGKAASLRRGMAAGLQEGASAVITLDGDGQHAPEDIPRLIAASQQNSGAIVVGARLHDSHEIPRARYLANRFANFWIAWAAGYPLQDSQSGFRLYPVALLRTLDVEHSLSRGFVFESEILIDAARAGVKSVAVAIPAVYSTKARRSHFRPVIDILLITRMVAWKLLSRGLYVSGLIRSLQRSDEMSYRYENPEVTNSVERS